MDPLHLRPTAPLAEYVLLPGDPGRALLLAQSLLEEPRMFNHHRGLWGYTGHTPEGMQLTIQSTGMGGPSTAIIVFELIALGARALVRVGTCGALEPEGEFGELLVVGAARAADGTSRALGAGEEIAPDGELRAALERAGAGAGTRVRTVRVVSTDLFYDPRSPEEGWRADGIAAVEMETATLLALARRHGVPAAALLAVSDLLAGETPRRIDPEALRTAEERLGRVAASALARVAEAS